MSGINNSKGKILDNVEAYVNQLNRFYARFDKHDFSVQSDIIWSELLGRNVEPIVVTREETLRVLSEITPGKACGPDKVAGKILKFCRFCLCDILSTLYQQSVNSHLIPLIWKTSEIVPVPKIKNPIEMNDFRPVALTSVVMKCLEKIIKQNIFSTVKGHLDPYQFAYIEGRGVEDATTILVNHIHEHLDKLGTYARLLFVDFSSAFNTIQPHLMMQKLDRLGVNSHLILWIFSYLSGRTQYVKVNNITSKKFLHIREHHKAEYCLLSCLFSILMILPAILKKSNF